MKQTRDWEKLWKRERIVDSLRYFLKKEGYHEVTTPSLLPVPSTEPFLEVFETTMVDNLGQHTQAFLPTSPEFSLKKLLAYGSGNIFEITKSFRNGEGDSSRHNPEFSLLEWYQIGGDYWSVAQTLEKMVGQIYDSFYKNNSNKILEYQGKKYDLAGPWERVSVSEAFEKHAGIDIETMLDPKKLLKVGREKGYVIDSTTTWEEIWNQIIANEIEPKLGVNRPTFLYDYPVAQAVLAKKKPSDPRLAERWELFIGGLEIANCFSELTDWREQESRCKHDLLERKILGKTEFRMDYEFIDALKAGLPECGGVAVGIDRLVMLFTDSIHIDQVMTFPASNLFATDKIRLDTAT